jgi:hypothetical protein
MNGLVLPDNNNNMSKLTEQQECRLWDEMTDLAKSSDKAMRSLAKELGIDYDWVRGVFDQLLDADFSAPKYYITKKSRDEPYMGCTWSKVGFTESPPSMYFENKAYAEYLAEQLSKFNPVGFEVKEVLEDEET